MTPRPGPPTQPAAPGSVVVDADGLLLDLDGVVWIDGQVLAGSPRRCGSCGRVGCRCCS